MKSTLTVRSLIRLALAQRCKGEHEYALSRVARWRITAKAIVCLLLGRDGDAFGHPDYDSIDVATIDGGTYTGDFGTHYWWEAFCVTYGWRHWRCEVYSDGAP